jgi:hypothetical protein
LKTTCETRTVFIPSGMPAWTKKINAEMPKTISGVTSVM